MSIEGDDKITVIIRVKPIKDNIIEGSTSTSISTVQVQDDYISVGGVIHQVDGCLSPGNHHDVYNILGEPLLKAALKGGNGCLLAYGQTGSGKTHTMIGSDDTAIDGVIPLFCKALLQEGKKLNGDDFSITISFYEIYKERIRDLLQDKMRDRPRVREHPVVGCYVEGVSGFRIKCYDELHILMKKGAAKRVSGANGRNAYSSRSHAVMEITTALWRPEGEGGVLRSKITLVDLAGSERSGSTDGERLAEGLAINRSLLTLGKVISALSSSKKPTHIPYRDSVLTRLLQENLGGNSKTIMLATISPEPDHIDETLSTLRYACRARKITNTIVINEDPQLRVIRELREEVDKLKLLKEDYASHHSKSEKNICATLESLEKECVNKQIALENLELKQKAAEEFNKIELSRLGMHLKVAEKRQSELENQRADILFKIKNTDISFYKSNFYDKLQNILNSSHDLSILENSFTVNSQHEDALNTFNKSLANFEKSCSHLLTKNIYRSKALPLLTNMKNTFSELQNLLENELNPSSDSDS